MSRIKPYLGRLAIIPIAIYLISAYSFISEGSDGTSFDERPATPPTNQYADWMARVSDSSALSNISIPGTHDSCALHNAFSFGFAKCQAWQVKDQLLAGVRFLDIRCRHIQDNLLIYHGSVSQRVTFKEVRDVCRNFLEKHPTECVIMSVKQEWIPKDNTRTFRETFAELTHDDGDLWYRSTSIPTLGSVRQRIVLLDRVGSLGGFHWDKLDIQDEYQATLDVKERLIKSHFEKALQSNGEQWFLNFCSGTVPSRLVTPRMYALRSNQVAFNFLKRFEDVDPVRIGTVIFDFPSEELVERVVETNFPLPTTVTPGGTTQNSSTDPQALPNTDPDQEP